MSGYFNERLSKRSPSGSRNERNKRKAHLFEHVGEQRVTLKAVVAAPAVLHFGPHLLRAQVEDEPPHVEVEVVYAEGRRVTSLQPHQRLSRQRHCLPPFLSSFISMVPYPFQIFFNAWFFSSFFTHSFLFFSFTFFFSCFFFLFLCVC